MPGDWHVRFLGRPRGKGPRQGTSPSDLPTPTLFRWLDKQSLAHTHTEPQGQVDQDDRIYNTERPHQGLPGRITPQQSWDATAVAEAPRPKHPGRNPAPCCPNCHGPAPGRCRNYSA